MGTINKRHTVRNRQYSSRGKGDTVHPLYVTVSPLLSIYKSTNDGLLYFIIFLQCFFHLCSFSPSAQTKYQ